MLRQMNVAMIARIRNERAAIVFYTVEGMADEKIEMDMLSFYIPQT